MLGIYIDSIARSAGIESENDVRIQESIARNQRVDAVESPADSSKPTAVPERVTLGQPWRIADFFQPSTNRFLI